MATGFNINGVDIDQYFDSRVSAKYTDVGFKVNGTDISNIFEPLNNDQQLPDLNVYFDNGDDLAIAFRGHPSQYTIETSLSTTRTTTWRTQLVTQVLYTFANSTARSNFFKYGGRLRVSGSRSGGSATTKNNDWTNMLAAMGSVEIGKTNTYKNVNASVISTIGSDDLTSSWQTLYTRTSSSYTANSLRVDAYAPASNQVYMRVVLTDGLNNSIDEVVDGTTSVIFTTRRHPTQAAPTKTTSNLSGS